MIKEHEIAKETINDFIDKKEPFTYDGLQDKIIENGGIMRIQPHYSVGEYIMELEKEDTIIFNPEDKKFHIIK